VPLTIPASARALIDTAPLAHVVSINPDGTPQVSCVWIGADDDGLYFASLVEHQKIRNFRRDSHVVVSLESQTKADWGVQEYLVVYGHATVLEGGAPEVLQRLAHSYIGPDAVFPNMSQPPDGFIVRITPERVRGVGPWMEGR
jgi:PPOX class probable F420-dependent enzyme